jgi:predicted AlkP superfamily phosphohydrolase/phosphomutase
VPAEVLVIGLDAAEATLIERWGDEGLLPNLAALRQRGLSSPLMNSLETLPGAIWPELCTGRSGGKLGVFYHPNQIHTGEARGRPVTADDIDEGGYYWSVASRAGRRVAVIDQPQTFPTPQLNGVQVFEWGLHDRNVAIGSEPADLITDLRSRHGDHPVDSCDSAHGCTTDGYRHLLAALLDGVSRKTALMLDVMRRGEWDLFAGCYGETHCAGHHFWHFFDAAHPRHDPAAPDDLRNALFSVYRRIDDGIGELVDAAGGRGPALVVASHGMGPKLGGPQLLPGVLRRLGMGGPTDLRLRLGSVVPRPLSRAVRRVSRSRSAERILGTGGRSFGDLSSPQKRAVAVPNNRCGAIRISLAGREPAGTVRPGAEADALIDQLRHELLALRDPASGQGIVERVLDPTEAFGPDHHPDVPDLMVVFRTDLGQLEACQSPRVGLVQAPVMTAVLPRTGDHTVQSRLWATGPGLSSGAGPAGDVMDIAPTLLDLLDVEAPEGLDGHRLRLAAATR